MRLTAVVNQIRKSPSGTWTDPAQGPKSSDEQLPRILEDAELNLSGSFRVLLAQLKQIDLDLPPISARFILRHPNC
jgi:hypothetical protein